MRANFDFDVHKSLSVIPAGDFSKVLMELRLNFFKSLILQLKTKIKSIRPLKPSIFGPIIEIFKRSCTDDRGCFTRKKNETSGNRVSITTNLSSPFL